MNGLQRWIAAYIAMDERRRNENLPFMERTAQRFPVRQKLALVASNNSVADAVTAECSGVVEDLGPRVRVCSPVEG